MVCLNETQTIEGDEMTKRVDNPGERGKSFFDGEFWEDAKNRMGVPLFRRLNVPVTRKADMKHFADIIHGLATEIERAGLNTALTEGEAELKVSGLIRRANYLLRDRAKIDLSNPENRGKSKTLEPR